MTHQPELFDCGRLPDRKRSRHARITASGTGIGGKRQSKRHQALKASAEQVRACLDAFAPAEWRTEKARDCKPLGVGGANL